MDFYNMSYSLDFMHFWLLLISVLYSAQRITFKKYTYIYGFIVCVCVIETNYGLGRREKFSRRAHRQNRKGKCSVSKVDDHHRASSKAEGKHLGYPPQPDKQYPHEGSQHQQWKQNE